MRSGSFGDESVVVVLGTSGDGVVHFDDSLCRDEDGAGSEGLVFDVVFLQMAESYDAAG